MKSFGIFLTCFILMAVVLLSVCGCTPSLEGDTRYYYYQHDMATDRFVKMSTYLTFSSDLTGFTYVYNENNFEITGHVEYSDTPKSYTLVCGDDVATVVKDKYREQLIASGASDAEVELYDLLREDFSPRTQLIFYNGYLFKTTSVEMARIGSTDKTDLFEGEFMMTATGENLLLRSGNVYSANDETKEFTEKQGYYTTANGILTLTFTDDDGHDLYKDDVLYRKRYLMARIDFPEDGDLIGTDFEEQLSESSWIKEIKQDISDYYGKTIAVLTDEYFLAE